MEIVTKVDADKIERVEKKFAALNRKAKKLGLAPIKLAIGEREENLLTDPQGRMGVFMQHSVTVSGEWPQVHGWQFVATLEHTNEGNLVKCVPGESLPESFRSCSPVCEHCKKVRRRTDTFVLRSIEGRLAQVGRNCLSDYMSGDIAALLWVAEVRDALNEFSESGTPERVYDVARFLGYVFENIARDGWASSKLPRSTAGCAWSDIVTANEGRQYGVRPEVIPTEENYKKGRLAAEWAASLEPSSDFEHNIAILARLGYVRCATKGFAAAIAVAFDRDVARRKAVVSMAHVGTVGKREVFTLTVTRKVFIETMYGVSTLHIMRDAQGNSVIWKSSSEVLSEGSTYRVKGTVKEHGEYKGAPQTVLTRCACEEIVETDNAA